MTIVNHYKCDVCGTVYHDKKTCEACENGHKKPIKIIDMTHLPISSTNSTGFPDKLTVATETGEEAVYEFVKKKV